MAHIRTIPPADATGPLKDEYDTARQRAGYVAQILQLQSLNPAVLHAEGGFRKGGPAPLCPSTTG